MRSSALAVSSPVLKRSGTPETKEKQGEWSLPTALRTVFNLIVVLIFSCHISIAQTDSVVTQIIPVNGNSGKMSLDGKNLNQTLTSGQKNQRQWLIAGINTVGYGGSLILLGSTWYTGYAKTKFHTFNDGKEWLQVDKVGHAWGAYNASRVSAAMWKWAGVPSKKSAWIGALSSTAFLTGIEFMDAYSAKWGWSWSDFATNFIGAGLFMGQELAWNEQRIQFKFSFHKKNYTDPILDQRADNLFGKPWYERMLKDYNAQTYWFSANLKSFFPKSNLPEWLNISVGYGADGMYGGFENKWTDLLGNEINRTDIPRKRQYYLAPDIDFTKIKTKSKWLRTAFTFLNAFKCPAPSVMMDSKGKLRAYVVYF